ncbi:MAG: Slp family lipoprotein [Deltaproteobacteria bacterium]|nr:Slp family lipoprotein [Deltaproteobacteria bacterium]
MRNTAISLLLLIILAVFAGCAPVISEEALKDVDREINLGDVIKDPEGYAGKGVVFGGTIISAENLENRTILEVIQHGMNSRLNPVYTEESAGRFLVDFPGFKDPAIYANGKRITVAGKIKGVEEKKLGKGTYRYPVVEPKEHYLWPRQGYGEPSIGIGFGIGYTHID